jgi:hypothetical protein
MNLFGGRKSKKQIRRENLAANRRRGDAAQDAYKFSAEMRGLEVVRTGRGSDYRVRDRDFWTGRVKSSKLVEVKSGKAKLSKLQRKTKRKHPGHYTVVRENPSLFW